MAVQENDIHEAVLQFLLGYSVASPPEDEIFCLSIDSDDSIRHDPPDALLQQLGGIHRILRKASECKITKKRQEAFFGVYDKKSGKSAWMISVGSVKWLSDQEVRVWGRRLCGGLCMWSTTLKAQFEDGKWKVSIAPDAAINMSQADVDRDLRRNPNRVSE